MAKPSAAFFANVVAAFVLLRLRFGPARGCLWWAGECVCPNDVDHVCTDPPAPPAHVSSVTALRPELLHTLPSPFSEVSCCKQVKHRSDATPPPPLTDHLGLDDCTQKAHGGGGGGSASCSKRSPCSSDFTLKLHLTMQKEIPEYL